jgi:hypothetical protein
MIIPNNMSMLYSALILHHYNITPSISIIPIDMMLYPLLIPKIPSVFLTNFYNF